MFYLNKNTELTTELLGKMINKFRLEVLPKRQKWMNYYNGVQAILQKAYSDASKPCNRTVINYCKNIVDSYRGYIATPGFITYSSNDDITEVMDILRYNDYQSEDSEFLHDALVCGTAAELMYTDNMGKVRFRLINPLSCFGVCDDSLTGDLIYFVRMYKANEWDDSDLYNVDVYSDFKIKHYTMNGLSGALKYIGEDFHFFGQCPANIFSLPDEKSIFDCVMTEQDSINELISAEIDDYSAFCDAYLTITGAELEPEQVAEMKENRVMLLPDGAVAAWLTKNSNDAQVQNIFKRLHDAIYRTAACPDFSSESFVGGVSSGVAIRYRLTGCETRAGTIEGAMKKALQRRVELICGIASLKLGEQIFQDIKIEFERNIPSDNTDMVNLVNALKGTVSDRTLLSMIPSIDVEEELKQLAKEKKEKFSLYDFGAEDEEEELE